ncbi:hypothetical protein TI39_contig340g00024 [Zymoseptoria brevis]|uniref:Uncharacterized protein n=1 Tax=Zymoseptoria brevis TaxID=1047168 RepID=A0A0F4GSE7_9PEZI|nr:hypothetical protein TI39_contig340g00024 [Zymoseptoria brevis]
MTTVCLFFRRLFKWIPGPAIAKLTPVWPISHHLDGSYDQTVQELHLRHGSLVQVGPALYSLSDRTYFDTLSDLEAGSYPTAPAAVSSFQQLLMSNIFRNEHLIDACNEKLFAFFAHSAQIGAPINLSNIIARYAYDVMIATTTGQLAGFLDTEPDPAKVDRALKSWRFYAILYGSYLRYHPIIAAVRKLCGMDKIAQDERFTMTPEAAQPTESTDEQPTHAKHGTKTSAAPIEARIALSLAGADPTMSLILKAIQQMFTEEGLLDRLRDEITAADLSYPIPFQQLISRKDRLSLMLGLLSDCLHAQSGRAAKAYTVPKAGISVGNAEVPEGATILLEPTPIPHVNPPELGGDRWLNSSLAPDLKHHLFAHNITNNDGNSITMFQVLLGLKTCIHLASNFSLREVATMPWSVSVTISMVDKSVERDEGHVLRAVNQSLRSSLFRRSLSAPRISVSAAAEDPLPITPESAAEFVSALPSKIVVKLPPASPSVSAPVVAAMPSKAATAAETVPASRGRSARGPRTRRPGRKVDSRLAHLQATQPSSSWVSFGGAAAQQAGSFATPEALEERRKKVADRENASPPQQRTFTESWAPGKPTKKMIELKKTTDEAQAKAAESKPVAATFVPPHLRAAAKAKAEKGASNEPST